MDISQKKKYRIPKIQLTELIKVNKLKCPSEDTAVPRGKEEVWDVDQGREGGGSSRKYQRLGR